MEDKEIERIKQGVARAGVKGPWNQILRDLEVLVFTVEKFKLQLKEKELQLREVWELLDSQPSGPGEGMVSESGEVSAQFEWSDKYRALKAKHGFTEEKKG